MVNVKAIRVAGTADKTWKQVTSPSHETASTLKHTDLTHEPVSLRDFESLDGAVSFGNPQKMQTSQHTVSTQERSSILKSKRPTAHECLASAALLRERREKRAQEIKQRKAQNPFGYKFLGLITSKDQDFQTHYRSQEWAKVLLNNRELERDP